MDTSFNLQQTCLNCVRPAHNEGTIGPFVSALGYGFRIVFHSEANTDTNPRHTGYRLTAERFNGVFKNV